MLINMFYYFLIVSSWFIRLNAEQKSSRSPSPVSNCSSASIGSLSYNNNNNDKTGPASFRHGLSNNSYNHNHWRQGGNNNPHHHYNHHHHHHHHHHQNNYYNNEEQHPSFYQHAQAGGRGGYYHKGQYNNRGGYHNGGRGRGRYQNNNNAYHNYYRNNGRRFSDSFGGYDNNQGDFPVQRYTNSGNNSGGNSSNNSNASSNNSSRRPSIVNLDGTSYESNLSERNLNTPDASGNGCSSSSNNNNVDNFNGNSNIVNDYTTSSDSSSINAGLSVNPHKMLAILSSMTKAGLTLDPSTAVGTKDVDTAIIAVGQRATPVSDANRTTALIPDDLDIKTLTSRPPPPLGYQVSDRTASTQPQEDGEGSELKCSLPSFISTSTSGGSSIPQQRGQSNNNVAHSSNDNGRFVQGNQNNTNNSIYHSFEEGAFDSQELSYLRYPPPIPPHHGRFPLNHPMPPHPRHNVPYHSGMYRPWHHHGNNKHRLPFPPNHRGFLTNNPNFNEHHHHYNHHHRFPGGRGSCGQYHNRRPYLNQSQYTASARNMDPESDFKSLDPAKEAKFAEPSVQNVRNKSHADFRTGEFDLTGSKAWERKPTIEELEQSVLDHRVEIKVTPPAIAGQCSDKLSKQIWSLFFLKQQKDQTLKKKHELRTRIFNALQVCCRPCSF